MKFNSKARFLGSHSSFTVEQIRKKNLEVKQDKGFQ